MSQLPHGWRRVALSEICEKTKKRNPTLEPEKTFKYVDVSSVSNTEFRVVQTTELLGSEAPSRARKLLHANDIIFATVRPTLKRVAMIPPELHREICSTGFCIVRADANKLDANFAYYFLLSDAVENRVKSLETGATYPAINDTDLLYTIVSLPSIAEQEVIANSLRSVKSAKEACICEMQLEREYKAALMAHLFAHGTRGKILVETPLGRLPHNWKTIKLKKLGHIQSGGTPSRAKPEFYGGHIPWIKTLDLNENFVLSTGEKITEAGLISIRGKIRPVGTVMVAMYGGAGTVGKTGILAIPSTTNQAVCCIEPNPEVFDSFYLLQRLIWMRAEWMRYAIGTRKDPNISKGIIENFEVGLPPLDEQQEISVILRACDDKIAALEDETTRLDELFRAMLEELMSGRLRVPEAAELTKLD